MTSTFVRKLLVAGVAVAALSVAACSKPSTADNTVNAADNSAPDAMAANNTAATDATTNSMKP